MLSSLKFTNFLFQILSALIDQIRFYNELVPFYFLSKSRILFINDMALDDMVLDEVSCSPLDYIMMQAVREQV